MEFRILGPLEVIDGGKVLSLGGAKQRAVLALLLLNANRVVSTDRLIDGIWGDDPPARPNSNLQVYVSNLRRLLEPTMRTEAKHQILITRPPGYMLLVGRDSFDAFRFEDGVSIARRARESGDQGTALTAAREALALWRGPVLADLAFEPFAEAHVVHFEEMRLAAIEEQVEAEVALGRHGEVIPSLTRLVTDHPLRERLYELYMLALYRSGRQSDALQAYRHLFETLQEQLGIDHHRSCNVCISRY